MQLIVAMLVVTFFYLEHLQVGNGLKSLIANACVRQKQCVSFSTSEAYNIEDDEVILHLKLGQLVNALSPTNNRLLSNVIHDVVLLTEKRMLSLQSSCESNTVSTFIPSSFAAF